jgi:hypothetical protein
LAISALGGDGELAETLFEYVGDYYNNNEILGILDNIRLLAHYGHRESEYAQILKECVDNM